MSFCLAPAAVKFAAAVVNNECSAHVSFRGRARARSPESGPQTLQFRDVGGYGSPMTIAIVGGGICGLSLALNLHARGIAVPRLRGGARSEGARRRHHAAAACDARAFRARPWRRSCCAPASRTPRAASSTASASSSTGSRAARRRAISTRKSASIAAAASRALSRGARAASARTASSPTTSASASSRTRAARTLAFKETTSGAALPPVAADIVIACDGVNSALRRQLVGDSVVFTGINTWRGVTRHKPILTGAQLSAHRLDPHRQDRDLSDRRRRRRRGQPADQLDHRDQARHRRDERLEQAGRS